MGGSGDLSLRVVLSAQDKASGMLKNFGSTLVNLAGKYGPILSASFAAMAAVVAIGTASVQMAAQYQQSLNMVQSLTGASSAQMAQYDTQLKSLAIDAGVAPNALAQGLFQVISSGAKGTAVMQELTLATEDAKIGMTDATTTATALTNILATFGVKTKDITRTNGEMLETVTLGKATFQQYASSITKAASSSKQFGVSMETMNAAWATLTSTGISAGQATTDYTQLLSVMYGNIGTVTKSLLKNGIAFNETKFNAMSFGDKVKYLNSVLQEANNKHVHITGVTKQAAQAIQAIASHVNTYKDNLKTLSNTQAMNGKTADAWKITQSGLNQQLSRAQAAVSVLMIDIGQQLIPVITKLVSAVAPAVMWFINFATAVSKNPVAMAVIQAAVITFAGVILAILLPALAAWAVEMGTVAVENIIAMWPVYLVILAIIAVIAVVILIIKNWGAIAKWLQTAWAATANFFKMLWQKIIDGVKWLVNAWLLPWRLIGQAFIWLYNHNVYFKKLIDFLMAIVKVGITWLQGAWQNAVNWLGNLWSGLKDLMGKAWRAVSSLLSNAWNMFVAKPLQNLWKMIVDFANGWPKQFVQFGINLIQGFINGIASMLGKVKDAATNIIKNVASILGFHSPAKEGEGRYIIQWGQGMIQGFSSGVLSAIPALKASVAMAVHTGLQPMSPPALASIPYGRPPSGNSYSNIAGGGNHYGNNTFVISGAGNPDSIAKAVEQRLNQKFRRSGVMGNPAYGARNS